MLSQEEKSRYSRHLLLNKVGEAGQERLKAAKALVIGAGGLGCPVLLYLSAAGVGKIGVIDFDQVDLSNLQRQVLYNTSDVGQNKAVTAKKRLEEKNPLIELTAYDFALTNKNAIELFELYDIIIDGSDNFSTRYLVNDACTLTGKPLVYGAIHKFEGQVSVFNYKDGPTYRCLFPDPPSPNEAPSCSEVGVLGVLPGIIGMHQATEALKIILEIGKVLSGRIMILDTLGTTNTEVKLAKKTELIIKSKEDFEAFDYDTYCNGTEVQLNSITKEEFKALSENEWILDVREDWEQPRIEKPNVIIAPLEELDDYIDQIPTDKAVYVVCQKGGRSQLAIDQLRKSYNFENLINLDGGIIG
jgi:adenylyltransferase/sulfurtransferase